MFNNIINSIKTNLGNAFSSKQSYVAAPTPVPQTYDVPERGVKLTMNDINALKPLLYGEISNRPIDKKELESRVILNTAINRVKAYNEKGQQKTLAEVLSAPNQYQAFGGNQYKTYENPTDEPARQKKQHVEAIVEKLLGEMKAGHFQDNTAGAYYYIHHPDGSIQYDDKKPLFKSNIGKKI